MSIYNEFDRFRRQVDSLFNNYESQYLSDYLPLNSNNGQQRLLTKGVDSNSSSNTNNALTTVNNDNTSLSNVLSDSSVLTDSPIQLRLDISETDHSIHITGELPGVNKNDIQLHIDNNMLHINAKKLQVSKITDKQHNYVRTERSYGNINRSVRLPDNADTNTIQAKLEHGILYIDMNKTPQTTSKPTQYISIE